MAEDEWMRLKEGDVVGNGAKVCPALLCMPYTPELVTASKGVLHHPHFAVKKI